MNMKHRLARIKKGFTLLELTVVIATTSILLLGFTAFTIFFSNQYAYEMDINENENSAIQLKYAISNNIDKFNYTYEYSDSYKDFNYNADKIVSNELIFSTVTPIEAEGMSNEYTNVYSGVIIRDFKFIEGTAEVKPYFGYLEKVYKIADVNNYIYQSVGTADSPQEREITLRNKISGIVPIEEEFKIYQTLSRMELEVKYVDDVVNDNQKCKEFSFTIDYDFEKDDAQAGTKQLTFNKYVYFIE